MFYFTNYKVLIAISNIMKGVINDEKIDMISKFYNLYAQILLSEANIRAACNAATRSSDENSVRPSNACIVTKRKKEERKALSSFLYHTKKHFSLVFWEEEWDGGATP